MYELEPLFFKAGKISAKLKPAVFKYLLATPEMHLDDIKTGSDDLVE